MIELLSEPLVRKMDITMPAKLGFHLRLAAGFVECVREFHSSIRIRKGTLVADGKSILGVLVLGAAWKSTLEIEVRGADAPQAMERIKEFFLNQENINGGL